MINAQFEFRKKVKIIHLSKNFSTNRHFGEGFWAISMDIC
nr:MAG TPA: hypothetical protein [Bacteriophage sp.]